ncbi:hypothetical protein HHK36_017571 [Tetracentron sinense]|uniref:NAC domain-containing protein n=1 Tax=Tetracentron sinense TaxID=13715 RepID=A0A834YX28_TETSI|nr:hypothetical protein HHK36_017571 [Tetracentron sinense]
MTDSETSLPPGFRFHPTDEELILHYLRNRSTSPPYLSIIAQVDIYKFDPWELPAKAAFGDQEWYFFSPRDRKYPNGARPNRAAASGYWKATGTDKPISASTGGNENIGVKKALVFYKGRPPKGIKTNWIMHEYRLAEAPKNNPMKLKDSSMKLDDWVLYRIYRKSNSLSSTTMRIDQEHEDLLIQDVLLPNLRSQNTPKPQNSSSFSNLFDAMDYSILAHLLSDNQSDPVGFEPNLDQPIFNSCTNNSSSSNDDNNNNRSSNYLLQTLPQMDSTVSIMKNQLKRPQLMAANSDGGMLHPSKKLVNSCSFTNGTNQLEIPQYHFLNQQYVLDSEQFQR